jgi:hypothetical protein
MCFFAVMWCRFGQQDAGQELLRATDSGDPDMQALARAMLAKGARRLRDLDTRISLSVPCLRENYVDEIMRCLSGALHKLRLCDSVR